MCKNRPVKAIDEEGEEGEEPMDEPMDPEPMEHEDEDDHPFASIEIMSCE